MKPTHALKRAMERFPGVCPGVLIRNIQAAFLARGGDLYLEHLGAADSDLCGAYRFKAVNGAWGCAIINDVTGYVVTVVAVPCQLRLARGVVTITQTELEAA